MSDSIEVVPNEDKDDKSITYRVTFPIDKPAFDTMVDKAGQPTKAGIARLVALQFAFEAIIGAVHSDNTGATCRIDLQGHDCCYLCNAVEDALRAVCK